MTERIKGRVRLEEINYTDKNGVDKQTYIPHVENTKDYDIVTRFLLWIQRIGNAAIDKGIEATPVMVGLRQASGDNLSDIAAHKAVLKRKYPSEYAAAARAVRREIDNTL